METKELRAFPPEGVISTRDADAADAPRAIELMRATFAFVNPGDWRDRFRSRFTVGPKRVDGVKGLICAAVEYYTGSTPSFGYDAEHWILTVEADGYEGVCRG